MHRYRQYICMCTVGRGEGGREGGERREGGKEGGREEIIKEKNISTLLTQYRPIQSLSTEQYQKHTMTVRTSTAPGHSPQDVQQGEYERQFSHFDEDIRSQASQWV